MRRCAGSCGGKSGTGFRVCRRGSQHTRHYRHFSLGRLRHRPAWQAPRHEITESERERPVSHCMNEYSAHDANLLLISRACCRTCHTCGNQICYLSSLLMLLFTARPLFVQPSTFFCSIPQFFTHYALHTTISKNAGTAPYSKHVNNSVWRKRKALRMQYPYLLRSASVISLNRHPQGWQIKQPGAP
jgi:hypothetical protein